MLGYKTAVAGDGKAGIELARRLKPALVLLDMRMPVSDGVDFLRALRSDPDVSSIPVVLVTAAPEPGLITPAKILGVQGQLLKSRFSIAELADCVRAIAGPPESQAAA